MKKNEKYMVKPLNEKEQRNVSGGFARTGNPFDFLDAGNPDPLKKPDLRKDLTKFY